MLHGCKALLQCDFAVHRHIAQKSANRLGPGSSFCSRVVHRRQETRQGGEVTIIMIIASLSPSIPLLQRHLQLRYQEDYVQDVEYVLLRHCDSRNVSAYGDQWNKAILREVWVVVTINPKPYQASLREGRPLEGLPRN